MAEILDTITNDADLDAYLRKRYSEETLAQWAKEREDARKAHRDKEDRNRRGA